MNSRQRRKREADRHNELKMLNEAYREDRARDPAKYKRNVSTKKRRAILAATMGLIAAETIAFSKDEYQGELT